MIRVDGLPRASLLVPTPADESCASPSTSAAEAAPAGTRVGRVGRAEVGTGAAPLTRAERAASDARATSRAAELFRGLCSPESFLASLQLALRDQQMTQRESDSQAGADRADIAQAHRDREQVEAREAAERASHDREIASIFSYVASGIALLAGTVGAIFSGGATLVAAIGLVIAIAGPLISNALVEEGVLPMEAGLAVSGICVAVGSIMSFGAGAAGGAATVAAQAANVAVQLLNTASAAVRVGQGTLEIAAAVEDGTHAHSRADAESWGYVSEAALDDVDDATDAAASLMREFARMAERLRAVADVRHEGMRVAMRTFA